MAIKAATWNAHSIFSKKLEFINFLQKEAIDIIAISETHLRSHQSFNLPNHSFIRLDRDTHGGIGIAVHHKLKYRILSLPNTRFIEAAGIEVLTGSGSFKLFAVYCPKQAAYSNGTANLLRQDLTTLVRTRGDFLIAGDLNAKHQSWGNQRCNKNGQILFEAMQSGSFTVVHPR